MKTKLTLNLNQDLIKKAKSYAKKNQVSLDELVEDYLYSLMKTNPKKVTKISPLVESLTGVISANVEERKCYFPTPYPLTIKCNLLKIFASLMPLSKSKKRMLRLG